MFLGKTFCALRYKINVRAFIHHQASRLDRVTNPFDAAYAAGTEGIAVHHDGIKLDLAVAGEEATPPGVKGLIFLHINDGFLDGIHRAAAAVKNTPSRGQSSLDAVQVVVHHVIGHGPGPAMDY